MAETKKKTTKKVIIEEEKKNEKVDNKNNVADEIKEVVVKAAKSAKNNNPTYLFFKLFLKKLRTEKLYFFSFLITVVFIVWFSVVKLDATEGYYDKKNDNKLNEDIVTPIVNPNLDADKNNIDDFDVSSYVGIYSREVIMSEPYKINDSCTLSSYKTVYQIKKDKSIFKYFVNDCVGTIKVWDDKLSYVSKNGVRYINAHDIDFLFSFSSIKEVDGETYNIDEDIKTLKENQKVKNVDIYNYDSGMVFLTNKDLVLVKGSSIAYQLSNSFISKGGTLNKLVYKSESINKFNFIVFNNDEPKNCYAEEDLIGEEFVDDVLYTIYSIEYSAKKGDFNSEKEIVVRNKSEGCAHYKEDLELLKK